MENDKPRSQTNPPNYTFTTRCTKKLELSKYIEMNDDPHSFTYI